MAVDPTLADDADEKDAPLRDDIRLLGRILGDTVREQEGEEAFAARRAHPPGLDPLPPRQRGRRAARARGHARQPRHRPDARDRARLQLFLASRQHRRGPAPHPPQPRPCRSPARRRAPARSPTPSTAPREAGASTPRRSRDFFDRALVSPVLTAHPTEVRRKSTLTRELEIAELLDERERAAGDDGGARRDRGAAAARGAAALAHQHAAPDAAQGDRRGRQRPLLLRLHVLSRAAAPLRRDRGRARRASTPEPRGKTASPSFLRVGSWIGGDRDGNPFVTADVLSEAMRLQSARALGYYLDELHELGGELSLSLDADAASARSSPRSPTASATIPPARSDEPYRRAIAGIYARLAKTARELDHVIALRQPIADAPAYATVGEFAADLATIARFAGGERRRDPRARAPAGAAARGRRVRLPSRADRPAAEFRRARAHGRRTARRRRRRASTICSSSEEERIALLRRELALAAPAGLAVPRL